MDDIVHSDIAESLAYEEAKYDGGMDSPLSFQAFLRSLDVPDEISLSDDVDTDWLWGEPDCAHFLNWLITSVDKSNIVSESQQKQYEILLQQGKILSDHYLDQAWSVLNISDDVCDEQQLDLQIQELTTLSYSLDATQLQLQKLSNDLSHFESKALSQNSDLNNLHDKKTKQVKTALSKCADQHKEYKEAMSDLKEMITGNQLMSLNSSKDNACTKNLIHRMDFTGLFNAEGEFTSALADFTDKRFFNGLPGITGQHDENYYELVNLTDPNILALHQDTDESLQNVSFELSRLQQTHSTSLALNVEAWMNVTRAEVGINTIKESLDQVLALDAAASNDDIRAGLKRSQDKSLIYEQELSSARKELDSVIEKATRLKEVYILTGDYNLKLARQQYFLDCQQQVIDRLIQQRARNEITNLMAEIELDEIRHFKHILMSISSHLSELTANSRSRLLQLDDAEMISKKYDRSVIDSRDLLLNSIDKIIDSADSSRGKVFTSYKELAANAALFKKTYNEYTQSKSSAEKLFGVMKEAIDGCVSELGFSDKSVESVTPREIPAAMSELKSQLFLLESSIKVMMSNVTQRKKLMQVR